MSPIRIGRRNQKPLSPHASGSSSGQKSIGTEVSLTLALPPSTNKLYQKRFGGGMALTAEAKKFREKVKRVVVNHLAQLSRFPVDPETAYEFEVILYFEKVENPGWFEFWTKDAFYTKDIKFPKKHTRAGKVQFKEGDCKARKGERKAKTRYKKIDYDNRIKFLQDSVVDSIGIPDDSQIFRGKQEKREDPDNPRAEVVIRVTDINQFIQERR